MLTQHLTKILGVLGVRNKLDCICLRYGIHRVLSKGKVRVKVRCTLHEFETLKVSSYYFSRKRSFELHELVQHQIVVLSLKQHFTRVHFVETAPCTPNIDLRAVSVLVLVFVSQLLKSDVKQYVR